MSNYTLPPSGDFTYYRHGQRYRVEYPSWQDEHWSSFTPLPLVESRAPRHPRPWESGQARDGYACATVSTVFVVPVPEPVEPGMTQAEIDEDLEFLRDVLRRDGPKR